MVARSLRALAALLVPVLVTTCSSSNDDAGVLRVGILLPLSGPQDLKARQTLEWVRENVEVTGGVAGHRLELVYADTAQEPVAVAAKRFAEDPSIVAVVGPETSTGLFEIGGLGNPRTSPSVRNHGKRFPGAFTLVRGRRKRFARTDGRRGQEPTDRKGEDAWLRKEETIAA
jgi:hypothetical protein